MGKGGPSARSRAGLTGALLAGMKRENSKVPAVGQLHDLKQSRTDLRSQRTKRMHQILSGSGPEELSSNEPEMVQSMLRKATNVYVAIASGGINISVSTLKKECSVKHNRSMRANRGMGFLAFFTTCAIAVYLQRNGVRSEAMTRALANYFLLTAYHSSTSGDKWPNGVFDTSGTNNKYMQTSPCVNQFGVEAGEFCEVPPAQMKTFTELANVEEFWDWVSLVFIPKFYQLSWENGDNMKPSETNTWMRKIRPIVGMRLVQRRAMIGSETRDRIGGGCWSGLDGEMRKFAPDCYDALQYSLDGTSAYGFEDRSAFGTFTNSTKYKFESFKSGANALTYPDEEGFFVFFPLGGASAKEDALKILNQLKNDRWVDRSTQWLKIEMLVVNADERVVFMGRFMLHITNIGLVVPVSVFDTFQVTYYDLSNSSDLLRAFFEGAVVFFWAYNLYWQILEFRMHWKIRPQLNFFQASWSNAMSETHSLALDVQLVFGPLLFSLWGVLVNYPFAGGLNISADKVDWDGMPIFMSNQAVYSRTYFVIAGSLLLLQGLRIITLARINPQFSLLSESMEDMQGRILNFAMILIVFLVMFNNMAIIMFGDKLYAFSEWAFGIVVCFQLLIGTGGRLGINRLRGDLEQVSMVDYPEMYEVSPATTFIWYYPFFAVMGLVVINITVAIIGESYARVKASRSPDHPEYSLSPTEYLDGGSVSLVPQVYRGVKSRMQRLFPRWAGLDQHSLTKGEILARLELIPEYFDFDCATPREFFKVCEKEGINLTIPQIKWIIERYPCMINTSEDLEVKLLAKRTPPALGAKKMIQQLAESFEDVTNRQAAIHAKLDLLIRMATV